MVEKISQLPPDTPLKQVTLTEDAGLQIMTEMLD